MSGRSAAVETFLDSVFGASGGSSKKAQARKTKGKKRKSSTSK